MKTPMQIEKLITFLELPDTPEKLAVYQQHLRDEISHEDFYMQALDHIKKSEEGAGV